MSGQEAKENFLINGLKSDGKKRQKTTQQIFLGGEKVGNAKHFYIKTNADNIQ